MDFSAGMALLAAGDDDYHLHGWKAYSPWPLCVKAKTEDKQQIMFPSEILEPFDRLRPDMVTSLPTQHLSEIILPLSPFRYTLTALTLTSTL
jgi:hypothetical protein